MLLRLDALERIFVLLLILSTLLVLIGNHGKISDSHSESFSFLNNVEPFFDHRKPGVLVSPGNAGIAITFNGWAVDNWYGIKNLLNEYGAKVTFFVGNLGNLTNDEFQKLNELKGEGHEIATQGFRYLDAVEYVENNSIQSYIDDEITPALEIMDENNLFPTSFAYPFGSRNSTIDAELLKHFTRLRATAYSSNTTRIVDLDQIYYKWENESLIRGVGIDVEYGNTIEELFQGLERAEVSNEVLVLYAHTITYEFSDYGTPVDILEAILDAAQTMDLVFYRVSDLMITNNVLPTMPTDNNSTQNTNYPLSLNDFVLSVVLSCVGIGLLYLLVSVIFRDERSGNLFLVT